MQTIREERRLLMQLIRLSKISENLQILLDQVPIAYDDYYLKRLFSDGLASKDFQHQDDEGYAIYDSIRLTESGRHYFEIRHEEQIHQVIDKLVTPITVSIMTTIVLWIIGWLTGVTKAALGW